MPTYQVWGSLTASSSRSDVLWGTAFSNINTANGVLENGSKVGVSEALLAEAHFFRGMDYFLLVQTFGGVPLDLGAGELKFNVSTSRTSVRNTVPEVYTKAVFSCAPAPGWSPGETASDKCRSDWSLPQ